MIAVSEIDTSVIKELGSFFSNEAHTDVDRVRYYNSAVRDLCDRKQWDWNKFNETFTIATIDTAVQTKNQIAVYYVYDSEGTSMSKLNFEDYYDARQRQVTANIVGVWGNTLIAPATGTYTMTYSAYPEPITSLT